MTDLAQVLADAREEAAVHDQQLAAHGWLTTADLAARWRVDPRQVRGIPRPALPYLEFGASKQRRYKPEDVAAYEETRRTEEHAA